MRRTTAAEKKLTGTFRPGRDRKRIQFVVANGIASKPPAYVKKNKLALAEWKFVAPFLEAEGILTRPDVSLLSSYCVLYSRWRQAALDVDTNGQTIMVTSSTRTGSCTKPVANPSCRLEIIYQAAAMRAAVKFGLNPLDRPRVESPEADDENGPDPFDRFLEQNDDPELDYIFKPSN
jgi:P27 family predicted phage terminase small subunit